MTEGVLLGVGGAATSGTSEVVEVVKETIKREL